MVLSRLSDPRARLWKSCTERVAAFSPDGKRMATMHILSDGIGPGEVQEREIDGTLLGDYRPAGSAGSPSRTTPTCCSRSTATPSPPTVRCSEGACENATDPVAVQHPRAAHPGRPSRRVRTSGGRSGSLADAAP